MNNKTKKRPVVQLRVMLGGFISSRQSRYPIRKRHRSCCAVCRPRQPKPCARFCGVGALRVCDPPLTDAGPTGMSLGFCLPPTELRTNGSDRRTKLTRTSQTLVHNFETHPTEGHTSSLAARLHAHCVRYNFNFDAPLQGSGARGLAASCNINTAQAKGRCPPGLRTQTPDI